MSIINAFPATITNGQLADATVVMSLLTWIQTQTNGNACPATVGIGILKGNGSGGTATAAPGVDYASVGPLASSGITGAAASGANTDITSLIQTALSASVTAAAGGTVDAITATFTPNITSLVNGVRVSVTGCGLNATTTPTFAAGTTAATGIVKGNNLAPAAADIRGIADFEYNTTYAKWVLLNPATGTALVAASTTASGVARLATLAETQTGTDATISVTPAGLTSVALGAGQTWTNVTRTAGTNYTNATGKPQALLVVLTCSGQVSCSTAIQFNGAGASILFASIGTVSGSSGCSGMIIIPAGQSYILTDTFVASRSSYIL